jgi:hypothetical protein
MTNSPKNNPKSQDWIKKAAQTASMGITTIQIYGHHQRVQAADLMATEAEVAAVEHITTVAAVVNAVDTQAASHIANVMATVDMVNSGANIDINNTVEIADTVDVAEIALSYFGSLFG